MSVRLAYLVAWLWGSNRESSTYFADSESGGIEAVSSVKKKLSMFFKVLYYAHAAAGQTVLILGTAGNVGAYVVQLSKLSDLHVVATVVSADLNHVRGLGAERVVDYKTERFEESLNGVDIVLDTVGGGTRGRSLRVLKPGGILVSVVSPVSEAAQKRYGVRATYFYVDMTTTRLKKIPKLFDSGKLATNVGTVLPLHEARRAQHEMPEVRRMNTARSC
jgi:NADPH:quinone reductase-like Zn-dependent oxidoreductase